MASAKDIILGQVFPVLGGVLGIIMFGSPIKAAHRTRLQKAIGDLNPLPFVITVANCAAWNGYGFAAHDYNMFFCNIPGLAIGLFTSITTYPFASRKMQDLMMGILVATSLVVLVLGVLSAWVMTSSQSRLLWGFFCNSITIGYYASPLSTALQVVRTRSSASIYLPTIICNFVNASLWLGYGLAVWDPFIYVPNGAGAACAVLLIVLCIMFPKKTAPNKDDDTTLPTKPAASAVNDTFLTIEDQAAQTSAGKSVQA
eukprot:gene9134-9302_t